jgi:hypothetical protein
MSYTGPQNCLEDTGIRHKIYVPLLGLYICFCVEFRVDISEAVGNNLMK